MESSRTIRYITGCSISDTGRACIDRIAILSEFQYEYAVVARPKIANTQMNRPLAITAPMPSSTAHSTPNSSAVFNPLWCR